jgi:hypothetical protein
MELRNLFRTIKEKVGTAILEEPFRRSLFNLSPRLEFKEEIVVYELKKFNTNSLSDEELLETYFKVLDMVRKFPPAPYKVITVNRRGYLHYPRPKDKAKAEFIRDMEKWVNENWNIRERRSFLIYSPKRLGRAEFSLKGELESDFGLGIPRTKEEFFKELAYFFKGDGENPFLEPLEEWDYGFKIGNRYCLVLAQFGVPQEVVRFANDLLNYIELDSIHLLHFEPLDRLTAVRRVNATINYAEKTNLSAEVVAQLKHLKDRLELGQAYLMQFAQMLFLFHEDPEFLVKRAWDIQSLFADVYPLAFEGNFEFTTVFGLADFDFLKGRDWEGYVNFATTDYVASLFPVWGRFRGKPKGLFIPMLNEALEPAYIPVDTSLFNLGVQGQMGSGKSVTNQYISSFFDNVIFIEKIQSDEGSYGVFVKYFGGNYIPISENIPVSLNPFGKLYEYFTVDVYQLLRDIGIEKPELEFSDAERGAMEDILNEFLLKEQKKTVSKSQLVEYAAKDNRTIRFKVLFEKLPDFTWEIKVIKNPTKKIFLNTVLLFMLRGTGERIDADTMAEVEKLLDRFYDDKYEDWLNGKLEKEHEVLLSEFYEFLENQEKTPVVEKLLKRLYSYKRGGKYGHIFDTPTNIDLNKSHYFFEVRINDPELLSVTMLSMLEFVNRHFGSYKLRNKTKLVVIDEGWFFLADPLAKTFIEEAFRTYRKRGIGLLLASQKPEDFELMVNYLPYICILYLEDYDSAVEVYKLNQRHAKLLKTIDKPKAYEYRFSKSFWKFKNEFGKNEYGLFLMPSYPEFRWIVETDPTFKLKREELTRQCGSLKEAIKALAFRNGKC